MVDVTKGHIRTRGIWCLSFHTFDMEIPLDEEVIYRVASNQQFKFDAHHFIYL